MPRHPGGVWRANRSLAQPHRLGLLATALSLAVPAGAAETPAWEQTLERVAPSVVTPRLTVAMSGA